MDYSGAAASPAQLSHRTTLSLFSDIPQFRSRLPHKDRETAAILAGLPCDLLAFNLNLFGEEIKRSLDRIPAGSYKTRR